MSSSEKTPATEGSRLREVREALKLKSQEMASRVGISRGYLSELENDRADASDKILRAMQVELGVNSSFIRHGTTPMLLPVKKFTEIGKQVEESVGGDAFPGSTPPEAGLVRAVVTVVLSELQRRHLVLPPDKIGELISLIYEHVARDVPAPAAEGLVEQTARRYLRLVA